MRCDAMQGFSALRRAGHGGEVLAISITNRIETDNTIDADQCAHMLSCDFITGKEEKRGEFEVF